MSDKLLTPDDLAEMFRLERRTILAKTVKQDGFPGSVTGTQKPRWLQSEVMKFLRRKSQAAAVETGG